MRLRWVIVGVGIAGRARARAIAADPRARLTAVHRGRYASSTGAPELPFDEAVSAADAVAVCSPDAQHEPQVRAVLTAGRHVLVEFPLARSAAAGRALFAFAREVGRTLHVEHIELLGGVARTLAARVSPASVRSVSVHHSRPGPAAEDGASLGFANIARLHRLVAVAGPVAEVEATASSGRMDARLRSSSGAAVELRFEVGPGLPRRTRMVIRTDAGVWEQRDAALFLDGEPVPLEPSGGLFAADQLAATARMLDDAPPYVPDARILEVLDLAEELRGSSRR
jgi:biliverdin reductase